MSQPKTPQAWAARLTLVLNAAFGESLNRFPINVTALAKDYSHQVFPREPITVVEGAALGRFEGCLRRVRPEASNWGILYNTGVSRGRARFTVAHEFGHYLLHRHLAGADGITCSADDIARGQAAGRDLEREADDFSASLLMPLDDFRRQIAPRDAVDLHALSDCADRYGTSLLATTLKWLSYTERRAVLVVSKDGYVDWSRSSDAALKSGTYLRTRKGSPIEVPSGSLMANPDMLLDMRSGIARGPEVWFGEESIEMTLVADAYDFVASLIILGDAPDRRNWSDHDDPVAVPVDERFRRVR